MQSSGSSSPPTAPAAPSQGTRPPSPTRKRFALRGRTHALDPRIDAARGDLADIRLASRLFAPHYAAAITRGVTRQSPLVPAVGAEPTSEVLVGEGFDVLETSRGYAWGVAAVDGAVGYVPEAALGVFVAPTHIVSAPTAPLAGHEPLPMGSRIATTQGSDSLPDAGIAPESLQPLDTPAADFVALAEALVGTPAKPGGRSGAGVDDAGLVVLTLALTGIVTPRFRDLQAQALGHPVDATAPMLRGDLLFFADHVAIAVDETAAVHVAPEVVVREPVEAIIAHYGPLLARRRLP